MVPLSGDVITVAGDARFLKLLVPISIVILGLLIVISANNGVFSKENLPMLVTLLGILIDGSFVAWPKAAFPIVVTVLGIDTDIKLPHD